MSGQAPLPGDVCRRRETLSAPDRAVPPRSTSRRARPGTFGLATFESANAATGRCRPLTEDEVLPDDDVKEHVDQVRVPLGAGAALEAALRFLGRKRRPVRPRREHGVVSVGDGENAGEERNLLALEAVRIAFSVPSLLVVPDQRQELVRAAERHADPLADLRVELD